MLALNTFMTRVLLLSATLFFSPQPSFAQVTKDAPRLDPTRMQPILLVADLEPGEYFPAPNNTDCKKPNVVCIQMSPPPFSLKVVPQSTLYGPLVKDKIELTTHSHWGMRRYEGGLSTVLLVLNTDGQHFAMPKYAEQELVRSKSNQLYLPILRGGIFWHLPCSVSTLKEEIFSVNFERSMIVPESESPLYLLETFPSEYRKTSEGVVPRYGISITRLSEYLKQLKPTSEQMSCKDN